MTAAGPALYFAYGANVHPGWLRRRVPTAELLGAAFLPGHRLAFHKRGRDGAGRSDAAPSNDSAARLPGALYRLESGTLERLGAAGAGYHAATVEVEYDGHRLEALTWRADAANIAAGLLPWDWYLGLIRAGAECLDLPGDYRRWLGQVAVTVDRDAARAEPAWAVIAAGCGDSG